MLAACEATEGHGGLLRWQDLTINTDVIVISTPEIAGLPYVIAGLVATSGLAAALSTADGLLLAIAKALSHDIYYKMIDPNAPAYRRLVIARTLQLMDDVFFGFMPLVFLFSSLMFATACLIVAGIPAALFERFTGRTRTDQTRYWIWLVGMALIALPAFGNFFAFGFCGQGPAAGVAAATT